MNSPNATSTQAAVQKVISGLQQGTPSAPGSASTVAASAFSGQLISSMQDYLLGHPDVAAKAQPKAFAGPSLAVDPSDVASKDFWSSLGSIVTQVVPVVVRALSKDYQPAKDAITVPPQLAADKDFWDFLNSAVTTVVPPLLAALSGGKDFDSGTITPPTIPAGKDKSWWEDALSVVAKVAPIVISAIL